MIEVFYKMSNMNSSGFLSFPEWFIQNLVNSAGVSLYQSCHEFPVFTSKNILDFVYRILIQMLTNASGT